MSGECNKCGEHTLECLCNANCDKYQKFIMKTSYVENDNQIDRSLSLALSALNLAFNHLYLLGYELPGKIELIKREKVDVEKS